MDGILQQVMERHRRALLRYEEAASREMIRYYREAWRLIQQQIEALLREMEQAQRAGEAVDVAWLYRYNRLMALRWQIEMEIRRFSEHLGGIVERVQGTAVGLGLEHADAMAALRMRQVGVVGEWNRLPTWATEEIVGAVQANSPLRRLLGALPGEVGEAAADSLVQGVMLGRPTAEIARSLKRATGMGLVRARRIARTEALRAYREATRQAYLANREVVKGWIWCAALDGRTCPSCWAMHGTVHGLNERLDDHPNGRCAMIPLLREEEEAPIEPGERAFERLAEEEQVRILGLRGYEAYRRGEVTLKDFVGRRRSRDWGTMRYARSLRAALAAAERRQEVEHAV